jgi:hypothetical protein
MNPLYKLAALGGLLVVVGLGAYFYGVHKITVKWEKDKTAWQVIYDAQVAETTRIQEEWNKAKEHEDEWKIKAEAAGNDAAAIARRLRNLRATRCGTVPETPSSAGDSNATSGEPSDIGGLEERHFAACARDAERLGMWQVFYRQLAGQ